MLYVCKIVLFLIPWIIKSDISLKKCVMIIKSDISWKLDRDYLKYLIIF